MLPVALRFAHIPFIIQVRIYSMRIFPPYFPTPQINLLSELMTIVIIGPKYCPEERPELRTHFPLLFKSKKEKTNSTFKVILFRALQSCSCTCVVCITVFQPESFHTIRRQPSDAAVHKTAPGSWWVAFHLHIVLALQPRVLSLAPRRALSFFSYKGIKERRPQGSGRPHRLPDGPVGAKIVHILETLGLHHHYCSLFVFFRALPLALIKSTFSLDSSLGINNQHHLQRMKVFIWR